MKVFATLRRHRLFAVLAALAMFLTQPALAAFCPCLSANDAPTVDSDQACVSACCGHCCTAQPGIQPTKLTAARCSALDANLHQTAARDGKSSAQLTGEDDPAGVTITHDFSPSSDRPGSSLPSEAPTVFEPPRALAATVARRCHPCNAPPVS